MPHETAQRAQLKSVTPGRATQFPAEISNFRVVTPTNGGECVVAHGPSVYCIPMTQDTLLRRAGACITAILLAAIAHANEHASYGPQARHQHGSAQLNLVVEGRLVHIELISPAVNLFGFEHAPVSEAEHAASRDAFSTLEDADRLFRFDKAASCRAEQAEVVSGSEFASQASGQEAHHHHAAGDDNHGATQHADIAATYRFSCDAPEGPLILRVGLFEAFPAID